MALLVAVVPLAAPALSAEAAPLAADAVISAGVTTGALRSVAFVSATTGFAAADNGVIVKTTDGGESWTQVRAADAYTFRGIDFWSASTGVAVDHYGKVASTTDGGDTWTNVDFNPYPTMDGGLVNPATRTHNDVACLWGGMTAMTAAGDDAPFDGTWTGGTSMGTSGNLRYWGSPLTETKPHRYLIVDQYYDVGRGELLDVEYVGTTIWASGIDYWTLDGANPSKYPLFKSTDGGINYTKVSFGTTDLRFEGISFGSATAGITVGQLVGGNRRAYFTTDGGTAWTSATTLPGTAVLNAVDMSSATQAWAVSGDGTIIRTTDGGANWTACTITGGNPYPLYDVEFIPGTTTGWAVGASGTVLLTSDGITWRQPTGPPNTAPVATADSYTTAEDTAKVVVAPGVLGNDTDADGDTLTAIKVANPSNGSVTLNSNGSFTYT
ncbi:MAG: Ig-like domain-containing protein, partial [Coriobacteriia bacterium]|nr:Ig-like domain-containing protein [Coriobacteriia bacterium]